MLFPNGFKLLLNNIPKRSNSIVSQLRTSPVLVSSSRDVYSNLAIEHWLYSNLKFNHTAPEDGTFNQPIVFMWVDEPCVVMGRHQNPWIEARLSYLLQNKIKLARRHSGGGCVFHDENNINISIIGGKELFGKRQENLSFVTDILKKNYNINCQSTPRHDIIHSDSGCKVSGSASKLGRFNSYHHFTILVDTDKDKLYNSIRQEKQPFVHANSTQSTRSKVINLKEIDSSLTVDKVINDLVSSYHTLYTNKEAIASKANTTDTGHHFTEINKFRESLNSWEWIYGMTPKFKLEKELKFLDNGVEKATKVIMQVNKGLCETIAIEDKSEKISADSFQHLINTKFTLGDVLVKLAPSFQVDEKNLSDGTSTAFENEKLLLATFLLQMINDMNA